MRNDAEPAGQIDCSLSPRAEDFLFFWGVGWHAALRASSPSASVASTHRRYEDSARVQRTLVDEPSQPTKRVDRWETPYQKKSSWGKKRVDKSERFSDEV